MGEENKEYMVVWFLLSSFTSPATSSSNLCTKRITATNYFEY